MELALIMELDQLNGERAVLRGPDGAGLTISRAMWNELGRPGVLRNDLSSRLEELHVAGEPAA